MADPWDIAEHGEPQAAVTPPFCIAADTYEAKGIKFYELLTHCLAHGEVQSNREFFCMGIPQGETFHVTMLAGDFGACARFNQGRFKSISFQRIFKGSPRLRTIPIERLASHG